MKGLPKRVSRMGLVELRPEERQQRVTTMEAAGPGGGEVGEERDPFGMREDRLHVPTIGSAQLGRPEYPKFDHRAADGLASDSRYRAGNG